MGVKGLWLAGVEADRYTARAVSRIVAVSLVAALLVACGGPTGPARAPSITQALTGTAEWLEFEPTQVRTELFREVVRQSAAQDGQQGAVLFPVLADGELRGARALDARVDLLSGADAGTPVLLSFDCRAECFSEDRRDAFQGLSEREAAEQVARSLLAHWRVDTSQPVAVVRAAGAPWAAAWIDGELRLNPAFVYMASVPQTP